MTIVCNWKYHGDNEIVIGTKEGDDNEKSHSMCPRCAKEMKAQAQMLKMRRMQPMFTTFATAAVAA